MAIFHSAIMPFPIGKKEFCYGSSKGFTYPILLITFSFLAWAARELVDDFNGPTENFTRWSNFDPAFSAGAY
jgi:hypothetical protein